jgi:hypothetical protein
MVTLHWSGFPALMNWLARGEVPVDGCPCSERPAETSTPPTPPESAAQRETRWAEEAADYECAPVRWGNFR